MLPDDLPEMSHLALLYRTTTARHAFSLLTVLTFLTLLWAAGPAAAQGTVPLPPAEHDGFSVRDVQLFFTDDFGDPLTSVFLNELFGPLFPSADGSGARQKTVFSTIIGYFNVVTLFLGALLFSWNSVAAVLTTAYEGRLLGRRWSSLWVPIRVLFAIGLLIPLPNLGGYNMAQAGVAYVVRGATASASFIWTTAAGVILADGIPIASPQPKVSPDLVRALYGIAVCQTIVERQLAPLENPSLQLLPPTARAVGDRDDVYTMRRAIEVSRPNWLTSTDTVLPACGYWETPKLSDRMLKHLRNSGLSEDQVTRIMHELRDGHLGLLDAFYGDLRQIAADQADIIFDRPSEAIPPAHDELARAITSYNEGLSRLVERIRKTIAESAGPSRKTLLLNHITGGESCRAGDYSRDSSGCFGEGWIGAGSWYITFARINDNVASFVRAEGQATERDGFFNDRKLSVFGRRYLSDSQTVNALRASFLSAFENDARRLAVLGFAFDGAQLNLNSVEEGSFWDKVKDAITDLTFSDLLERFNSNFGLTLEQDPMIQMIDLGHSAIIVALALYGASVAPHLDFLAVPASIIWAAGALLQLVLPLMPFILWIIAVTGYFLLIVEAVVAVTLWAFAHLRLEGEGLSGHATRGWTLLLALLLTPLLMVVGFLVGMMIFRVTAALLLTGIYAAAYGALADANIVIKLLSLPVILLVVIVMQLILIERSFSLVSEFPNRVLKWIDSQADLADQGALGTTRAGLLAVSAGLTRVLPGDGGRRLRQGLGAGLQRLRGDGRASGGNEPTNR